MTTSTPSETPSISHGYQKDTEYSVQLLRWVLKPISAWPTSSSSSIQEKILSEILFVICFSLILCTLAPCALGTLLEEGKDMETRLREIGPLSYWILLSMNGISYTSAARIPKSSIPAQAPIYLLHLYYILAYGGRSERSVLHALSQRDHGKSDESTPHA
ncbi:hypothetical protein KM043_005919 [Ampulex compressa]|nr:hypothetical protein KM043_005919 [Ampulex compressa]